MRTSRHARVDGAVATTARRHDPHPTLPRERERASILPLPRQRGRAGVGVLPQSRCPLGSVHAIALSRERATVRRRGGTPPPFPLPQGEGERWRREPSRDEPQRAAPPVTAAGAGVPCRLRRRGDRRARARAARRRYVLAPCGRAVDPGEPCPTAAGLPLLHGGRSAV